MDNVRNLLSKWSLPPEIPERNPTAEELLFFRGRPEVAGMATDDDAVTINPFSTLPPEALDVVRANERARVFMGMLRDRPQIMLSPVQQADFRDYSPNEQDIRETVLARLYSGDQSAGEPANAGQAAWVSRLREVLGDPEKVRTLGRALKRMR